MKNLSDIIRNGTRDLPSYSASTNCATACQNSVATNYNNYKLLIIFIQY